MDIIDGKIDDDQVRLIHQDIRHGAGHTVVGVGSPDAAVDKVKNRMREGLPEPVKDPEGIAGFRGGSKRPLGNGAAEKGKGQFISARGAGHQGSQSPDHDTSASAERWMTVQVGLLFSVIPYHTIFTEKERAAVRDAGTRKRSMTYGACMERSERGQGRFPA